MSLKLTFVLLILISASDRAFGADDDHVLIALKTISSGHGRSSSLELRDDGTVVDSEDVFAFIAADQGSVEKTVRIIPKADLLSLTSRIANAVGQLPRQINPRDPKLVEGGLKMMRVKAAEGIVQSAWGSPESSTESDDSRRFEKVWTEISRELRSQ